MQIVDIVLDTTYASTSIQLPSGLPPIAFVPTTTHYLQGIGGFKDLQVRDYGTNWIKINKTGVAYNIVKLKYRRVGELVRT
jgi:hypothetical protein